MPSTGTERRAASIVLVNPNTNEATTAMMADLGRASLAEHPAATVHGVTVRRGPAMIIDPAALADSAQAVIERIAALDAAAVDAVVVSAIGDPGRDELEVRLPVPVVGIGQAAILEAAADGRKFAMATTTHELAGSLSALVEHYGCSATFHGVFLTRSAPLELAADPDEQEAQLREATEAAVAAGAEAVIIAGGPLSETARRLRETSSAVIIEPIPAAIARVQRLLAR
ncbi:aspartate/glutamate racemase family protein [Glutamicibacter endophyticus]|uniref:aspartate/glutamate racemase family protein n=1 Tax=Glutamicibacter sp. PS TaxID=3075634 RepID=UPI002849D462|nr:aspartate/glutamate racemase family protein [Glutamicibacter sp. PS]MDR4534458.1 aspartate/glutamate racemase family protein [Glutamicibacter sp. PS]